MKPRSHRFLIRNLGFLIGVILLLVLSGACQTKPTKAVETPPQPWARLAEKTKKPLKLTDDTVVLDSRNDFDYGLAHWSDSVHFSWRNLLLDPTKPWSLMDGRTATDRLALLGIQPRTPILVIGYGLKGVGDDGRLAWTLVYYGLEDVQTVSIDGLDVYFTHQETPPLRNVPPWTADVRDDMVIDRNAFLNAAMKPRKNNGKSVFILDVRSKEEYFSRKGSDYETPDLRAVQIDWKEFFSEDGRPKKSIRKKLQQIGVKLDDEIITISNHGTRSGAVAYALTALGFQDVRNFLGGWESLLKHKSN
jgi:thiosulfate/3-mercaptopyruvate sulfurtransferase